jgi:hypothetical protein
LSPAPLVRSTMVCIYRVGNNWYMHRHEGDRTIYIGPVWGRSIPTTTSSRTNWIRYGKYFVDTVITFHPVGRQLKTILPAYHAADALWEYYQAYDKGGPSAVRRAYVRDRAIEALTDLQTEATWNLIGADRFVPAPYKEPARGVLSSVMGKISEKEVDFIEGYLERRTSS